MRFLVGVKQMIPFSIYWNSLMKPLCSPPAGLLVCYCGRLWHWEEIHTRASLLNASLTCSRPATGWSDRRTARKKCELRSVTLHHLYSITLRTVSYGMLARRLSDTGFAHCKSFPSAGITSCSGAGNKSRTRGQHSQTSAKSWKRWWWKVGYGEAIQKHKLFIFFHRREAINQHLSVHYWHKISEIWQSSFWLMYLAQSERYIISVHCSTVLCHSS